MACVSGLHGVIVKFLVTIRMLSANVSFRGMMLNVASLAFWPSRISSFSDTFFRRATYIYSMFFAYVFVWLHVSRISDFLYVKIMILVFDHWLSPIPWVMPVFYLDLNQSWLFSSQGWEHCYKYKFSITGRKGLAQYYSDMDFQI